LGLISFIYLEFRVWFNESLSFFSWKMLKGRESLWLSVFWNVFLLSSGISWFWCSQHIDKSSKTLLITRLLLIWDFALSIIILCSPFFSILFYNFLNILFWLWIVLCKRYIISSSSSLTFFSYLIAFFFNEIVSNLNDSCLSYASFYFYDLILSFLSFKFCMNNLCYSIISLFFCKISKRFY
jgi:hypothetical protein